MAKASRAEQKDESRPTDATDATASNPGTLSVHPSNPAFLKQACSVRTKLANQRALFT